MYRHASKIYFPSVKSYKSSLYASYSGETIFQGRNLNKARVTEPQLMTAKLSQFQRQRCLKKDYKFPANEHMFSLLSSLQRFDSNMGGNQHNDQSPRRIKLFGGAIIVGVTVGTSK